MFKGPTLKDDWKGKGVFGTLADWLNTVAKLLNGFAVQTGGRAQFTERGLKLFLTSFPWHLLSFGPVVSGLNKVTIQVGNFVIRGRVKATLAAATELTLTGSTAHIYAEIDDDSDTSVTVGFSANYDATTIGKIRKYLYKFESSDGGVSYHWTQIYNMGDIYLDTPA